MKMKFSLFVCVFLSLLYADPPPGQGYALKWSDEFDCTVLDTNNWSFDTGGGIFSGSEEEYYTNGANLTIENGSAVLWTKKEYLSNYPYTSCRIKTQGKREFNYGYIEVRLKAPEGKGLWPAFWALGSDYYTGTWWPGCGQFDIFNTLTGPNNFGGLGDSAFSVACNFKGANGSPSYHSQKYRYTEKLSMQYHLYAVEWDSIGIKYFFDGNKFWEYDSINQACNFQSFHQPFFFIVDIAVGGNYQGNDIDTTIFPQKMYIDYVRVYQKSTQTITNPPKSTLKDITLINHSKVQLKVYDIQGRLIGDYTDRVRHLKPGQNVINDLASNLPIGIYLVRVFNGVKAVSEKLVIQK